MKIQMVIFLCFFAQTMGFGHPVKGRFPSDGDSVTVTFKVNTAFVQDTLSAGSEVSIRGTAFGGDWSLDKGIKLKNVGGDYWEGKKKVLPGPTGGDYIIVTHTASGTGWDRHQVNQFEITGDTTLTYFTTGLKETYTDPFTGASVTRGDDWSPLELAKNGDTSVFAVHFRVNMQAISVFNRANHKVTVRGSFNGWSAADTLKPEVRHDDLCCGLGTYEAEYLYSKTILIPKASAGGQAYKFVWSDAGGVSTHWEDAIGGNRTFTLSGDTTLAWKWFDGKKYINCRCSPAKPFLVALKVDLSKAINTNGFNKKTDTLIARIGLLGTALKTVDVKFESPFAGTEYSGDTGSDSLFSEPGRVVLYKYYKKNAAGELEEFYFDNYNTEPQSAASKFRKLSLPLSGDFASSEDILSDAVSTHRQPFFKNMDKVGDATTLTLDVNLNPAIFYTTVLGGTLDDTQGGSFIVDSTNIRKLDVYVNGPATGGWKPWHADSLGESRKMKYLGRGHWSIELPFTADATVSQEFKLSIGGADNEAGFGNHHIANLFPSATNATAVQFGDINPLRYKLDDNNYWDFEQSNCFINGYPCGPTPHVGEGELPDKFSISAYPNPFNPATLISCSIPQAGKVSLKVFDLLGRQVAILSEEIKPAGTHLIPFRGDDLATGIYVVRMESGSKTESVKVILLK